MLRLYGEKKRVKPMKKKKSEGLNLIRYWRSIAVDYVVKHKV